MLAFTFLFLPAPLLYVWMRLPPRQWYGGVLCAKFGLLVSPTMWSAILQFHEGIKGVRDEH